MADSMRAAAEVEVGVAIVPVLEDEDESEGVCEAVNVRVDVENWVVLQGSRSSLCEV